MYEIVGSVEVAAVAWMLALDAVKAFCRLEESGVNAADKTRAVTPRMLIKYLFMVRILLAPPVDIKISSRR